ncbi:MAG: ubiquinone/menaquinone biosynthesis C-methylase UbiE/uncharacterized protein YbaR (Trm112 family) [Saprospiraceae bacterium]|jgi:ubiquinone/menaquinone biosynthesis C-methylase UbiE/uncharacterized protein YbaR (Trm112 family)
MEKIKLLERIKELYDNGENIIEYLKGQNGNKETKLEDIMISYDFQAGNYTRKAISIPDFRKEFCVNLASILKELGPIESILEIGVGEATTLGILLHQMEQVPNDVFGFDISWSRIKYAKQFVQHLGLNDKTNINLCTGDLFSAPFADSSIDVVYTAHSLEPNGGKEQEALEELYRIAKRYVVLLEPAFELADDKAKERMLKHGYVTKLRATADNLGYKVIAHRLFHPTSNPLNPTGLMIIKKENAGNNPAAFACPVTKEILALVKGVYFSKKALLAYPIIDKIPCLLAQNAIVATHFLGKDIL